MIHLETKFFSKCEVMKPDKSSASKMQWWGKHRIDISIPKGRNQKEEGSAGPQGV